MKTSTRLALLLLGAAALILGTMPRTLAAATEADHDHAHEEAMETPVPEASTVHAEDDGHAHAAEKDAHEEHAEEVAHDDHGEEGAHEGETEGEHAAHGGEDLLALTPAQIENAGIRTAVAGPDTLQRETIWRGEVALHGDRQARVTTRFAGTVQRIAGTLGARVKQGEPLATISSRELGELQATYLAARARRQLLGEIFQREERLWREKVTSEEDLAQARFELADADLVLRAQHQHLQALGFTPGYLEGLAAKVEATDLTLFTITAPIDGVILQKHLTLGEHLTPEKTLFEIADLSTVWVDLHVPMADAAYLRPGARVRLTAERGKQETEATLSYIAPVVTEATRTILARAELDNAQGLWRPGQFVVATCATEEETAAVCVPRAAVQRLGDARVVFVPREGGFATVPVQTGRESRTQVEILSGLPAGAPYVREGAFTIKAALLTSAADAHAGHGH